MSDDRCGARCSTPLDLVCDRERGHTGDHRGYNIAIDAPMFWARRELLQQEPGPMTVQRTIEIYADTRGKAVCKGCREPIEWAEIVKSGKKMCFTGEIVALTTRHDDDRRLIEAVAFDTNHWATCSQAKSFKR